MFFPFSFPSDVDIIEKRSSFLSIMLRQDELSLIKAIYTMERSPALLDVRKATTSRRKKS
jgi:hypothetical protein